MRFDGLTNFMAWFVSWLARFTGDYGLAIVLMTVIVRLVLFPLSFKQTVTMQRMSEKMQIIQPRMQEIRERYAHDPQKMNSELMELYRKHDYNPMSMFGGCLLLFLQMPIFVSLYQALQGSFDLRQQPFKFTWIQDLSAPDQLFRFGGDVPFLGPYFNLLPLLSLVQMLLQMMLMTPPAATPEMAEQQKIQKRMMMIMMVMIGFMFYRVPAGLCVYIITSTSWALLERQFLPKPKHPPVVTAASAPSTNGASIQREASWKTPIDKKKKR
jgi:YidC/Oxa1 family membrane protein insertase